MARYTVRMPDGLDAELAELVESDEFTSKQSAIRYYVRNGLLREDIPHRLANAESRTQGEANE